MPILTILSPSAQVAAHLRVQIRNGLWRGEVPGAPSLARELGVDAKTVMAALEFLEQEGMLVSQGVGRRRRIARKKGSGKDPARPLQIAILMHDQSDRRVDYLGEVQHGLVEAGHHAFFAEKAQTELGGDLNRLRRVVEAHAADAWVVVSGSRDILNWFCDRPTPSFALFGRASGVPIASVLPEKIPAYQAATDKLVALGHRRIVMLVRTDRRLPEPGRTERAFLQRLASHGIQTGTYNLPDWKDDRDGLHDLLTELFRVTPPTAFIIQEAFLFSATHHFVTRRGLRVPEDVSMVCSDDDHSFAWWKPEVSRIRWDARPVVRRVIDWAARIGRGERDLHQTMTKSEWIEGGTIGRAPG